MADSVAEIKKATKLYGFIGLTLFFFTILTVAVATVEALDFGVRGFDHIDAIIGLAIASIKASLVMLIFMHLNHEKKLVYFLFVMSIIAAIFLVWLTGWAFEDPITYGQGDHAGEKSGFYNPENPVEK
ncbi:MAG: cytochrome C oxidase subunit IV family protein [Verrucomicrobiota bacterium JB023]|nr:cytochrome C oxidase subunit IV family protein [Verrucomicrobiota bacterium JB023]